VQIDWYFCAPAAPLLTCRTTISSLNWSKPDYGAGLPGEVVGATRTYRTGERPTYIGDHGPEYTLAGYGDPFVYGWNLPPETITIGYDGRKSFPYKPYVSAIFPPFRTAASPCTLLWTEHPVGTDSFTAGVEYNWHSFGFNFVWAKPDAPGYLADWQLFPCFPGVHTLMFFIAGVTPLKPLRCRTLTADGITSTWDDPTGVMPGVLTLVNLP
jgi:hypothetical protein